MTSESVSMRVDSNGHGRPDLLAVTLLGLALALLVFLLAPPFLKSDVGLVHGFTGQELMDLFTPVVAMPLLVVAFELTGRMSLRLRVLLVVLVSAWVVGQAIHLATNAIGDLFPAGAPRTEFYGRSEGDLDHWFDEILSHWLWHVAWLALLGTLLWIGTRRPAVDARPLGGALVVGAAAGLVHGFTWFVVTDEGGTWLLALPATALLLALSWLLRHSDPNRVIVTFLTLGSLVTLALYAIWIAANGWPPASICEVLGC